MLTAKDCLRLPKNLHKHQLYL